MCINDVLTSYADRVLLTLQSEAQTGAKGARGVATGLAVVDQRDTYIALVT